MKKIKILVVDDSPVAREILWEILGDDPELEIIGSVGDGAQALAFMENNEIKPDVIAMDVMMPGMNGFEATRKIMESRPTPIVMITASYDSDDVNKTFQALEAGAVTILRKPGSVAAEVFEKEGEAIRDLLKVMAGVSVIRRWPEKKRNPARQPAATVSSDPIFGESRDNIRLIAIGTSTGGPMAIKGFISRLPRPFPVPIVIVQHIDGEFLGGMMRWLENATGFPFEQPRDGQLLEPDTVYIASDDVHIGIDADDTVRLSHAPPEEGLRPSVNHLFRSVAYSYGNKAVGILLTGMGRDGGLGMKEMFDFGAVTIAQDEQSSVVFGMPAEAIKLGAAQHVLPLDDIPNFILKLLKLK
ncbi:MAG: chemotaxis-specific protein-glutamate methyltransferase CheB [bacterium]|nr:chemotaxis-specific protein-glutamate methyltransferase CheB [bacterium]